MKIDLNEIWEFMELVPKPKSTDKAHDWIYELVAGKITLSKLSSKNISDLKKEENYDTELLPSIFTFREILWQPNVYTQPALCIPQLNILKVFCEDYIEEQKKNQQDKVWPYFNLLKGLAYYCAEALKRIKSVEDGGEIRITSILGDLRKNAFPIIKFFIFHPMNRKDYQIDALNRMNYAVKIMLTQYNNKYYDLEDPYWNVTVGHPKTALKPRPVTKEKETPESKSNNRIAMEGITKNKTPSQSKLKTSKPVE